MSLTFDIWIHIMRFIEDDFNKFDLLMTCKDMSKCQFYFIQSHDIVKVFHSKWYNHFINIMISEDNHLSFLHSIVTQLVIDNYYYRLIELEYKIPTSVTHLTFGDLISLLIIVFLLQLPI